MLGEYLLEQLHTLLLRHLVLDHVVQQETHDRQEGAHLLIRERVVAAEVVVNEVKVEDELVDTVDFLAWCSSYCV